MNDKEIDLNFDDIKIGDLDAETVSTGMASEETPSETAIDEDDINIGDKKAPIVMLFGPPTSGKSMTLVRLARYLRKLGYIVKADTTFKSGDAYRGRCDRFHKNLNTKEALDGNAFNEFLMVKVIKHGKTICQILEAAGEHYFNPKEQDQISARNFRPYMTQIIRNLPNRKIWVFIMEASGKDHASVKASYVGRIRNCKHQLIRSSDRVVILYNKVDQKEELFENGHLHITSAEKAMEDEYVGLSTVFKNTNPITSLWRRTNYRFVPFCTGYYDDQVGTKPKYTESEEMYPRLLWGQLMKCIKG
jgi:hypothetical protein